MTYCPRCRQPIAPGMDICPRCGLAVLSSVPQPGNANQPQWPQPGQPQQWSADAADGWAGPPPPSGALYGQPGYGQPGYGQGAPQPGYGQPPAPISVGGLVSEDALPEWMRAAGPNDPAYPPAAPPPGWAPPSPTYGQPAYPQAQYPQAQYPQAPYPQAQYPQAPYGQMPYGQMPYGQMPYGPSPMGQPQPYPAAPAYPQGPAAGAFPPFEQVGAYQGQQAQGGRVPAQSLLDASAIPQWLGGQPVGSPDGDGPNAPYAPSDGMSAGSLVEEQALPQWLRGEQGGSSPAAAPAASGATGGAPGAVSRWITSSAAEEPLPSWLGQAYANVQPAPPASPANGWASPQAPAGQPQPQRGALAAQQFVDDSALPSWLRAQGGVPLAPSPSAAPMEATGRVPAPAYPGWGGQQQPAQPAEQTFSAVDLIDPAVLPEWVQPTGGASPPSFNSSTGWGQPPAVAPAPPRAPSGYNAGGYRAEPAYGPVGEGDKPPWMRGAPSNANNGSPSSWAGGQEGGGLRAEEMPPWLLDGGAGGGMGRGAASAASVAPDGYGGGYQDAGYQDGPPAAWGAEDAAQGYGAFPQQGGYPQEPPYEPQYGQYDGYDGYDEGNAGYDGWEEPPGEQPPAGGLRRLFRRG